MTEQKKPFMSKWRKDRIREEHAANKARRRTSSGYTSPLTDPANPGAVYYQTNNFYPDGSYTSETSSGSGYASRSDTDYGSRDSGSSSSYDGGSSSGGGSYGE